MKIVRISFVALIWIVMILMQVVTMAFFGSTETRQVRFACELMSFAGFWCIFGMGYWFWPKEWSRPEKQP